jgi:hypothetical protein
MKKLLAIVAVICFAACNESKTDESASTADSTTVNAATDNSRATEISDSTRMLDKALADSTNPMTPDSLK